MFNLDPGKLIVIAVVAIILLGPDKLPQVARQVGGAWRTFNEFRHRMESEVRSTMPDLPPTSEIARLARSPSALLNHLSSMSEEEEENEKEGEGEGQAPNGSAPVQQTPTGTFAAPAAAGDQDGGAAPAGRTGEADTPVSGGAPTVGYTTGAEGPATNGKPGVAPQPSEVAVPADPTLN
ncbi:MAG TPA: twin-arginine translocase TatA/TatE family subunit [Acidimicrobiales bacterium]|jgi:sec-independent protein translocase protein TatB